MNLLATGGATMGWEMIILYVVLIFGMMYFMAKQNKKKEQIKQGTIQKRPLYRMGDTFPILRAIIICHNRNQTVRNPMDSYR